MPATFHRLGGFSGGVPLVEPLLPASSLTRNTRNTLIWGGYLEHSIVKVGCEAPRNSFRETLEKERPGDTGASPLAR